MKTKTKTIISAFTAMATVCISLSLTTVAFADENYEDDIYMSSFSDYTSDGLPNGWVAPKYVVDNKKEVENSGSDAHSVAENKYIFEQYNKRYYTVEQTCDKREASYKL